MGIFEHAKAIYDEEAARIEVLQIEIAAAGRRRAEALAAMYDNSGLSLKALGAVVGLSAPRVQQIIASLSEPPDPTRET